MWPTIDRARRRICGGSSAPDTEPKTPTGPPGEVPGTDDVVIVVGGLELEQLLRAFRRLLGDAVERPNTPARIERALSLVIASRGGTGRSRVMRRPAGLSTPEAWEIHLDGVDRETGDAVRDAGRTGSF